MLQPVFRTRPGEALKLVEDWVNTPALRELVELSGGKWPTGSLADVLRQLNDFSGIWDRRGGESRLLFKEGSEPRDDDRAHRIYNAVRSLGLLDSMPPTFDRADYVLILGGLATGVEPRARYAAKLVAHGSPSAGAVVALGSFRPIDEREESAAASYAPGANFEVDLLSGMVAEVFGQRKVQTELSEGDPKQDPARATLVRRFDGAPSLAIYAARSSEPQRRSANTADTYRQFADDVALKTGDTVLVVSSSIYRPYQHMDAVRILARFGAEVETVGVPGTRGLPPQPPSAYLQEVRSAIRSALAASKAATIASHNRNPF